MQPRRHWRLMGAQHRAQVLRAYRELLSLIKRLPGEQREAQWADARAAVRRHAGEAGDAERQELLKRLIARISFLRVVTPRRPGEASATGTGHYVLREGRLVEGHGTSAGTRQVG